MYLIEEDTMYSKLFKIFIFCLSTNGLASGQNTQTPSEFSKSLAKTAQRIESFSQKSHKSAADRAQYIKELYYSVNGYPDGYDTSQSPDPHLNLFNNLLGENGIGGILFSAGYETCDAIPDSGTASGSTQLGTLNLTMGTAVKTVPSYYATDSGETMDKRITVDTGGIVDVTVELKCNADTTIQTGFVNLSFTQYDVVYEGYFQQNSTTGAVDLDIYVKTETGGGSELLIPTQFSTSDGETFTMFTGYISLGGGGGNGDYLVAVNGETNGKAQMAYLNTTDTSGSPVTTAPNNFGSLTSAGGTVVAVECIDVPTETITTGCTNIPAPGSVVIGGTTSTWTLTSLKAVSL